MNGIDPEPLSEIALEPLSTRVLCRILHIQDAPRRRPIVELGHNTEANICLSTA